MKIYGYCCERLKKIDFYCLYRRREFNTFPSETWYQSYKEHLRNWNWNVYIFGTRLAAMRYMRVTIWQRNTSTSAKQLVLSLRSGLSVYVCKNIMRSWILGASLAQNWKGKIEHCEMSNRDLSACFRLAREMHRCVFRTEIVVELRVAFAVVIFTDTAYYLWNLLAEVQRVQPCGKYS